jgi:Zn-dependent peptidase ImmA (M78 family)
LGISASRDEREGQIDRFAESLLIPDADLTEFWHADGEGGSAPRLTLIDAAITYRLSWSVVVRRASRLGLVTSEQARHLRAGTPTRGDLLAVAGSEPQPDLEVGTAGAHWRKSVLAAWQQGAVTGSRAVELLHGAIREDELPLRELEDPEP